MTTGEPISPTRDGSIPAKAAWANHEHTRLNTYQGLTIKSLEINNDPQWYYFLCPEQIVTGANDAKSVSVLPVSSEGLAVQWDLSQSDHCCTVLSDTPTYSLAFDYTRKSPKNEFNQKSDCVLTIVQKKFYFFYFFYQTPP